MFRNVVQVWFLKYFDIIWLCETMIVSVYFVSSLMILMNDFVTLNLFSVRYEIWFNDIL